MKTRTVFAICCGVAGLALSSAASAGTLPGAVNQGEPVDVVTTVADVREVPAGNPMPGLHVDAKVNGKMMDIYIAPMGFVTKYGVKVAKGNDIHIAGTQQKVGEADEVVAREIETGVETHGAFHPKLTIYLRNADGPFWTEETPAP